MRVGQDGWGHERAETSHCQSFQREGKKVKSAVCNTCQTFLKLRSAANFPKVPEMSADTKLLQGSEHEARVSGTIGVTYHKGSTAQVYTQQLMPARWEKLEKY